MFGAEHRPIGKRCNDQPFLGTQVLELVVEIHVCDRNDASAVIIDVVRRIRSPIESCLVGQGMKGEGSESIDIGNQWDKQTTWKGHSECRSRSRGRKACGVPVQGSNSQRRVAKETLSLILTRFLVVKDVEGEKDVLNTCIVKLGC